MLKLNPKAIGLKGEAQWGVVSALRSLVLLDVLLPYKMSYENVPLPRDAGSILGAQT